MALGKGINISSMKINLSDKIIAWLALFSGLTISAVAIWYSVAGLVSIFAAAVIPIIVMGVALEISKLIATVWLKLNWTRAPVFIRTYLLVAIAILMLITSMGIFGFLSKAHSDAGLVSGDVQAKIAVYDEKIKTERENIDAARKALTQMDAQVNERLSRSTDDRGAERAVQIRRQQQAERTRLQKDISGAQSAIARLNEERAPIAAEVRKVEAEVGPIKYIANFIYGDNPDANILEKAVTWVIIIIVSVFDPLAVILLLASQYSFQWFRQAREEQPAEGDSPLEPESVVDNQSLTVTTVEPILETIDVTTLDPEPEPIPCAKCGTPLTKVPSIGLVCANPDCDPPIQETTEEEEDHEIMASAEVSEKTLMASWKHDHPDSSLKLQRRLFERGLITKLPWEDYLSPKEDFVDEAADEAAKWAEEQRSKTLDERPGDYVAKVDGVGYMENVDGHQVKKTIEGYTQNAEQNESTIWQRVKKAKGE
jgi:hypothetical protein